MAKAFDPGPIEQILGLQGKEKKEDGIREIYLNDLLPFHTGEGHPFEVEEDADMQELLEDVSENGILEPIIVRVDNDFAGRYEILAGHRRVYAANKLGLKTIKTLIVDYDDDDAVKLMVATNLKKRTHIKYSVKAKAYKMYMEANKKQAGRPNKNLSQVETNLRTDEKAAMEFSESRATIQRYIRLNELNPELLDMVDKEELKFGIGVELSYLKPETQDILFNLMKYNDVMPSLEQAVNLKKLEKSGEEFSESYLAGYFKPPVAEEVKEPKVKKAKLNERFVNEYLPEPMRKKSVEQKREYTQAALIMFNNYLLEHPEEKEKWER